MRDALGRFGLGSGLDRRLAELQARHPDQPPDMMAEMMRAVISSMRGDLSATEATLLSEVGELGRTIASAKAEIAALQVTKITASHIPSATDELDAIVSHTAEATDAILEVCETLDVLAATWSGGTASQLQDATMRIYEACSFQDITGQRITKVVAALKAIEAKVAQIMQTFGDRRHDADGPAATLDTLLNGPQLPMAAMGQSDIDKLLASLE